MDTQHALTWRPPSGWRRLVVIESHTGGEPFRVVVDGLGEIPGDTVLARRRYARDHLDDLRQALMWEPRGHADMYGGWIGAPTTSAADLSILFLHNEGFSTMCGHGIIALAKVVLDTGILPAEEPETHLAIDTPAGLVSSTSKVVNGVVRSTRFTNVPSFVADLDATADVAGLGRVKYDLGFGGAFYAFVDVIAHGLPANDPSALIDAGRSIKQAIVQTREISHPDHDDLSFLYGVVFTAPATGEGNHSRHVCVFADGEVDRSPTGTGVSARLAILDARGMVEVGEWVTVESIVGSSFRGRIAAVTETDRARSIVPEIEGSAHITGRAEIWIDPEDEIGRGFLLR
jgi:proline racemase